jgi:cell division protein DivIC
MGNVRSMKPGFCMRRWDKIISFFRALPSNRYFRFLNNKYVLTLILFFLWLLFFDQNNLLERHKLNSEYDRLIQEREYYMKKIEEDRRRIKELKTDNENLEKFAREQYLMKKDNEDIFVIEEDD